jgi:glycogen synthase
LVTPFYDYLKKKHYSNVHFRGFIDHEVDQRTNRSAIYELNDEGITQFLVQPDLDYQRLQDGFHLQGWDIVDVGESNQIYSIVYNGIGLVYFPSAMASAAALYRGKDGKQNVDVLQLNGRHLAISSALMQLKLNPERQKSGLPKVSTLATTHDTNEFDSTLPTTLISRAGLRIGAKTYNPHVLLNLLSDMSNTVSQAVAEEMAATDEKDIGLGELFSKLQAIGRFFGITNGIFLDSFDPRKPTVLGELHVKDDFSDIAEMKSEAKKALYDSGLIGSETKPLFLYVGRISWEKGIDVLGAFAKYLVDRGAQMVIMGTISGETPKELEEWKGLAANPKYQDLIKVYLDRKEDQQKILEQVNATKGNLFRFAADFTLVPSKLEACGLVPIEALAMGSGIITSNVQGLKDLCARPLNAPGNHIRNFSCVTFTRADDDHLADTLNSLTQSVDDLLNQWEGLSSVEKSEIQVGWIRESERFHWNHPAGSLDQYKVLFEQTMIPETEINKTTRKDLIDKYLKGLEQI